MELYFFLGQTWENILLWYPGGMRVEAVQSVSLLFTGEAIDQLQVRYEKRVFGQKLASFFSPPFSASCVSLKPVSPHSLAPHTFYACCLKSMAPPGAQIGQKTQRLVCFYKVMPTLTRQLFNMHVRAKTWALRYRPPPSRVGKNTVPWGHLPARYVKKKTPLISLI